MLKKVNVKNQGIHSGS